MARTKYTVTFPAAKAGDEVTWPNSVKVYADANIDRPLGNGYIETAAGSFTGWSDAASVTFTRAGTSDSVTVTTGSPTGTGAAVPSAASGVPTGGATGQVLAKNSATDSDVGWVYAKRDSVNVKDYGAKGNAVSHSDGVATATSVTFTSASSSFTAADIGKTITIYNAAAGPGVLTTTIAAVNSGTSVNLAVAAGTSGSGRPFTYGTDDTTAITNALAAAGLTNAEVYFPAGRYLDTLRRTLDNAVNLRLRGDSTYSWLRDNATADTVRASELVYIGAATSAQAYLSARGSSGFEVIGMGVRYTSSAFVGVLLDLSGNTNHTLSPRLSDSTFYMVNGVWSADACIDITGMVVLSAEHCAFGGAVRCIRLGTTDAFSNAVTFTRCNFDQATYAYDTVSATCKPSQLVFRDCTVETGAFGTNPMQFRFHSGDDILFDGTGFWDGNVTTIDWITTLNTVNALSVRGCYVQGGRYFINPATVKGVVLTGNYFINNGASGGTVFGPSGTVSGVVVGANSFDTAWVDNSRNAAGVLPEGAIARTVVGVAAASVTFSSIPQTYEKLRIAFSGRGDVAASTTQLRVQFNGDTAGNYDDQVMFGNAAATGADESIGQTSGRLTKYLTGGNPAAGNWTTAVTEILGYTRTVGHKLAQTVSSLTLGLTTGSFVTQTATARWRSTAAITSITLLPGTGNFAVGTVITLYGDS